jgi:hypothetical protein
MNSFLHDLDQAARIHHGGRLTIRKSRSVGWIVCFGGPGEMISFGARDIEKAAAAALRAFPASTNASDRDDGLPVLMDGEPLPL